MKFLGEEAIDEGGPKHEFWRLLATDIKSKMCIGGEDQLTLEHDVLGLQVKMCIIHVCTWWDNKALAYIVIA